MAALAPPEPGDVQALASLPQEERERLRTAGLTLIAQVPPCRGRLLSTAAGHRRSTSRPCCCSSR